MTSPRLRLARCPVGYSSPRRPRRSRCRPMNHPTMNTAPTKATITPADEQRGENDSGAALDDHDARRRLASMPRYGQSSGSPCRFNALSCFNVRLDPSWPTHLLWFFPRHYVVVSLVLVVGSRTRGRPAADNCAGGCRARSCHRRWHSEAVRCSG